MKYLVLMCALGYLTGVCTAPLGMGGGKGGVGSKMASIFDDCWWWECPNIVIFRPIIVPPPPPPPPREYF